MEHEAALGVALMGVSHAGGWCSLLASLGSAGQVPLRAATRCMRPSCCVRCLILRLFFSSPSITCSCVDSWVEY